MESGTERARNNCEESERGTAESDSRHVLCSALPCFDLNWVTNMLGCMLNKNNSASWQLLYSGALLFIFGARE